MTANFPFLSVATEPDPDLARFADRLVDSVPSYELTFSLDPSFLELLD